MRQESYSYLTYYRAALPSKGPKGVWAGASPSAMRSQLEVTRLPKDTRDMVITFH